MSSFARTIQKRIMRAKGIEPIPCYNADRAKPVGYRMPMLPGQTHYVKDRAVR